MPDKVSCFSGGLAYFMHLEIFRRYRLHRAIAARPGCERKLKGTHSKELCS